MKKKILGGIALLAIAALAAVNVTLSSQSNGLSGISLANVEEALAWEWNNPLDWFSYGLRADERIATTPCSQTSTSNESGNFSGNTTSPTGNLSVNGSYETNTQTNVPNR